ncbi:hypothetical protein VE26_10845 [Devosia chinhatensis]|uniref:Thiamine pyrimidine synthase n=1 Tax=Devosia chinhatensis TaxID=429727 RepID=A0A0F5FJ27_9HYPH|nr:hypothetical protein VE26_10845 [Devosia chinhatensis]
MACALTTPLQAAEPVSVTLDWTPNTNFVGLYIAQALGLYEDAGLSVTIEPFVFGQAHGDVAAFGILDFYTARAAGLDAVGVYAVTQTETGRLAYQGHDIHRPRDLVGKRYGGFGTTWEKAVVDAMIMADNGVPDYEIATYDGSLYDALRAGQIDFTLEVLTWQGVENDLAGRDIGAFRYADYGVPEQHTILLAADAAFLAERPETALAFVEATRAGYRLAVENPAQAAEILMAAAPELDPELVLASSRLMVDGHYLMAEDGTIGEFDGRRMEQLADFLFDAGALVDRDGAALAQRPDISEWYTNRYLD